MGKRLKVSKSSSRSMTAGLPSQHASHIVGTPSEHISSVSHCHTSVDVLAPRVSMLRSVSRCL